MGVSGGREAPDRYADLKKSFDATVKESMKKTSRPQPPLPQPSRQQPKSKKPGRAKEPEQHNHVKDEASFTRPEEARVAQQGITKKEDVARESDTYTENDVVSTASSDQGPRKRIQFPGAPHEYTPRTRRLLTANESSSRSMKPYQAMMLLCVIAGFIQM